jgi:hypothetical protein
VPGKSILKNPQLRRIRAKKMIAMRVNNWSVSQIGAHFQLGNEQVSNTLRWAEKEGVVNEFEDEILRDLVPLAIQAYKDQLNDPDKVRANTVVAKDILQGTGVLKKAADRAAKMGEPMSDVEIWMMKRKGLRESGGQGSLPAAVAGQIESGGAVVDAQGVYTPTVAHIGPPDGRHDVPRADGLEDEGEGS